MDGGSGPQRMLIMGADSGHDTHRWDRRNPQSVEIARAVFDKAIEAGYRAFHSDDDDEDEPGPAMTVFDPNAESMVLVTAYKGG